MHLSGPQCWKVTINKTRHILKLTISLFWRGQPLLPLCLQQCFLILVFVYPKSPPKSVRKALVTQQTNWTSIHAHGHALRWIGPVTYIIIFMFLSLICLLCSTKLSDLMNCRGPLPKHSAHPHRCFQLSIILIRRLHVNHAPSLHARALPKRCLIDPKRASTAVWVTL